MRKRLLGCLIAMVLLPMQGFASISNAELEDFELALWKVRADFHMLTVMVGSKTYISNLDDAIAQAQSGIATLRQDAEGSEERALVNDLEENWGILKAAAQGNTMAEQGFTNAYTIQDVNEIPTAMAQRIESFTGATEGQYDDIRELSAYLQRMTSEYLNIAADPAGGMASGSDEGRIEFKDAVPEFERMLAAAKKNHANDEAISRALNQVGVKWMFIRESMVKFYENAVSYLIYRYTNQMVDTMSQAISLASTDVEKPSFGPVE